MNLFLKKLLDLVSTGREINFARERMLAEYIRPLAAGRTTLEIGCSRGETFIEPDGGFYTGADLDLVFLREFRNTTGGQQVNLVQADATCLPFSGNSYQFIYTISTLELLELSKVKALISECARVGGTGAVYIFQFLNPCSVQFRFTKDRHWLGETSYSYDALRLSESRKLLTELGFSIVDEFHYVIIPYFLVNKIGRPWLARLDFFLSNALPRFAAKNMFVCRLTK